MERVIVEEGCNHIDRRCQHRRWVYLNHHRPNKIGQQPPPGDISRGELKHGKKLHLVFFLRFFFGVDMESFMALWLIAIALFIMLGTPLWMLGVWVFLWLFVIPEKDR